MSAKQKRTKKEEISVRKSAIAALNSLTVADTRPVLDELDRLRKLVFSTESDRMYLEKQLAELNELLIAEKRELEFWVEESDRHRDKVVALLRQQAVALATRKGDS